MVRSRFSFDTDLDAPLSAETAVFARFACIRHDEERIGTAGYRFILLAATKSLIKKDEVFAMSSISITFGVATVKEHAPAADVSSWDLGGCGPFYIGPSAALSIDHGEKGATPFQNKRLRRLIEISVRQYRDSAYAFL